MNRKTQQKKKHVKKYSKKNSKKQLKSNKFFFKKNPKRLSQLKRFPDKSIQEAIKTGLINTKFGFKLVINNDS